MRALGGVSRYLIVHYYVKLVHGQLQFYSYGWRHLEYMCVED